jgi:hypothetical protein
VVRRLDAGWNEGRYGQFGEQDDLNVDSIDPWEPSLRRKQ